MEDEYNTNCEIIVYDIISIFLWDGKYKFKYNPT